MRRLRKALMALMAVCMLVSGFSFSAYASSGQLRFSDPSTTVGAEVEVAATFTGTVAVQSAQATLTYDTSMLRFVSGSQVTDNNGTLSLSGAGDGTSTQLNFTMTFQALQEGTTVIEISSASGTDVDGDSIDVTRGQSTITIGPGDPSLIKDTSSASATGASVEVNGTSYVVSGDFSDAIIPGGFERSEMQFEGQTCTVVTQASSGATAMYLVPAAGGDGDFFLYNTDDGSFSPFEEIELSTDRYLILLQDDGTVDIPGGYQETTLTLNGKEFPAWQNTNNTEYYLVYGLNSDGNKVLYQYDTTDGTYQRYVRPLSISTDESGQADGILGSALQFIQDNLRWVLVAACVLFVLVVIILIVALVKLHHRNLELDDLYDEYGIDLDDEPEEVPEKKKKDKKADKKSRKQDKLAADEESEFDDGFEDYEDDDFEDGFDSEDEYDLDGEDEDSYEEEEYDDEDFDEDYDAFVRGAKRSYDDVPRRSRRADDEEDIDDLDALLNARVREPAKRPKKTPERRSHAEEDDTFKMDIIDLD